ncbi:MAG: sugar phosphate isomerase/epimerase, partial [Mesorhizobium sp.]
ASKTVDDNWQAAQKIWPAIIAHAREHGVKLAFENCPMIFSYDEWPGGHNIAYSPYVWRRILEAWGGDVGMNFDPSHLVWQMIDKERFIREFGPHMLHVHAKDLMIDHDGLYERGILSAGIGWQVPRMPGLGDINWSSIFSGHGPTACRRRLACLGGRVVRRRQIHDRHLQHRAGQWLA